MPTVWSDAPIKSAGEDSFGRSVYAQQIAHLIQEAHSWEDSIVFGLTGPWGSGKSSMLAMIEEQLASSESSRPGPPVTSMVSWGISMQPLSWIHRCSSAGSGVGIREMPS